MGLMLAAVCAIAAVLISIVAARFHNAALTRITAAQGVQEYAYITLGGIEQYVQIRGEDRRNPVILWLRATKCLGQLDVKMLERMIITSMKYLRNTAEMSGMRQMWTALASPQMRWADVKWFLFASNTKNIIESHCNLVDYMYFRYRIEDLGCRYPIPVCFIQGDSDWITPTPMVRDYYATVVAERKEMVVVQDAGHTPFLDHPQRFCAAVKEFLGDYRC